MSAFPPGSSLLPPMTLAETLSQHHPPTMVPQGPPGSGAPGSGPLMPAFVEALQSSLLAQQQKDLTAAMVTSIATLGAQLPTIPSLAAAIAAAQNPAGPSSAPMSSLPRADSSSPGPLSATGTITPGAASNFQMTSPTANIPPSMTPTMKCNLCDFSCTNKETLTKHTMIHMMEKPEQLYQVYSLMASAAAQAQAVAAAAAALATTSQQSTSGSSCGSTPAGIDTGMTKSDMGLTKIGSATTPTALYGGTMLEESSGGRYFLTHDASQDSGGSPASLSGGKMSGDEGMGSESFLNVSAQAGGPGGHRQRRKGRAFKLDRIALKLQGKTSDDGETESIIDAASGECENVAVSRATIGMRHTRSTSPAIGW